MVKQRWSWRWWVDAGVPRGVNGWPAGGPAASVMPLLTLLPLVSLRLTGDHPFAGVDLAFLVLVANLVVAPQLWALAALDRVRRGRRPSWNWYPTLRPAAWYRLLAGIALGLLLVDLAAVPFALALPSGVVGPSYPETVVFEVMFRSVQWLILALATALAASVTVLGFRVWRWAGQGAPLPTA
jgi:hypothetical protein